MRLLIVFCLFVVSVFFFTVNITTYSLRTGVITIKDGQAVLDVSNLHPSQHFASATISQQTPDLTQGVAATQDDFPVTMSSVNELTYMAPSPSPSPTPTITTTSTTSPTTIAALPDNPPDPDMVYKEAYLELPLYDEDYYYHKYENAVAGLNGVNKIPLLRPGNSIGVIKDMYINVKPYNGFVTAPRHYFGSGVCWTTSTLGMMMDRANEQFSNKFGLPLFVFAKGDRAPHGYSFRTYGLNGAKGYGYTILQASAGVPVQEYRFTINPALASRPDLAGIKIKIVMEGTDQHPTGSHGQSLSAYLLSNIEF